jgi:hypothetical protein
MTGAGISARLALDENKQSFEVSYMGVQQKKDACVLGLVTG